MYIPKRFLQDDINNLKGMMTNHAFATFISKNESGIEANHMPLILNESGQRDVLQGHIAKANPLWKSLKDKSAQYIDTERMERRDEWRELMFTYRKSQFWIFFNLVAYPVSHLSSGFIGKCDR